MLLKGNFILFLDYSHVGDNVAISFDVSYDEEENNGGFQSDHGSSLHFNKSCDDKFKVPYSSFLDEYYDYDQHILC